MIFAKGQILPDTALPEVLAGLEADINATRAALTLEPETVIASAKARSGYSESGRSTNSLSHFLDRFMMHPLL